MARCNDCNKFVPYDTDVEPELTDSSVDETTGDVTAEVRRVLTCGECGTEMKDSSFSFEVDADEQHIEEGSITEAAATCEHEWEFKDEETETDDSSEGRGRGTKTFYGAKYTFVIHCTKCNLERTGDASDRCQASHMEEL